MAGSMEKNTNGLKTAKKSEFQIYLQIARYMAYRWPKVVYRFDYAAGLKLAPKDAGLNKRLQVAGLAWSDLFIACPSDGFHGFFLEIKTERADAFRKDGSVKQGEHIQAQNEFLERMRKLGYKAEFGCGTDDCIRQIENYLLRCDKTLTGTSTRQGNGGWRETRDAERTTN